MVVKMKFNGMCSCILTRTLAANIALINSDGAGTSGSDGK